MSAASHDPASLEPNSDRPAKGRFTLGNKGGPGNPFARQVAEIRKLLLATVPRERLAKILLAMVEKAEAGDVAAAKLVLQYTAGKPAETVEPDRIELEDHRLRTESLIPPGGWGPPFGQLPVRTVNTLWEGVAAEMEEETLLPMLLVGLENEAAPPEQRDNVERKASRRVMRMLEEGIPPSPNPAMGVLRLDDERVPSSPSQAATFSRR